MSIGQEVPSVPSIEEGSSLVSLPPDVPGSYPHSPAINIVTSPINSSAERIALDAQSPGSRVHQLIHEDQRSPSIHPLS